MGKPSRFQEVWRRVSWSKLSPETRQALSLVILLVLFVGSMALGAGVAKWTSKIGQKESADEAYEDSGDTAEVAARSGDSQNGMGGPLEPWSGDSLNEDLLFLEPDVSKIQPFSYTLTGQDTIYSALGRFNVSKNTIADFCALSRKKYDLSTARSGQSLSLYMTPQKEILKFELRVTTDQKLVIAKWDNEYQAALRPVSGDPLDSPQTSGPHPGWVDPETGFHFYRGVVDKNFFDSALAAGMTPKKIVALIKVFGGLNFKKEVMKGTAFSVVVAPGTKEDEEGPVLAAKLMIKGKPRWLFRFENGGKVNYYNDKGKTGRSSSFICPVRYARISSEYTGARLHPILNVVRPHLGVDYAAPTGTPVKAACNGTVSFAGWRGGFGRTILVRHAGGYESQYGHLSGYGKGITAGKAVRQGQVIGYVGSSGLATGPHLDYRIYKNKTPLNPRKVSSIPDPGVGNLPGFKKTKEQLSRELDRPLPEGPPRPWPQTEKEISRKGAKAQRKN